MGVEEGKKEGVVRVEERGVVLGVVAVEGVEEGEEEEEGEEVDKGEVVAEEVVEGVVKME